MHWRKMLVGVGVTATVLLLAISQIQPTGKSLMEDVNQQKGTFSLPALPDAFKSLT